MADEPRRSGRATKGQHTKMETPEPTVVEPKKSKAKPKPSKKSAEPEPEEEEEEEEEGEEIIRCVCGHQTDDGGRMMVCCDNCNAWQHNDCMGVTEVEEELPENYLCEQCAPEAHKPLLEAMAKGEKPWEEIALKKQAKKKGKKAKPGRQSLKSEPAEDEAIASRSSAGAESNKRKHDSDADVPAPAAKARKSDSAPKGGRKPAAAAAAAAANEPLAIADAIAELSPDARKNVAASLKKKLMPLIKNASTKGIYKIPSGRTLDSESERFAILVEYSLFMNHCGHKPDFSGPYKQQLLRILSNIEKNEALLGQLVTGQLTPDALAVMTSEEMASDEHRQRMQEMKEEVEKQSILLQDDSAPKMRRTHKGDEIIDDGTNDFTSESILSAPIPRRRESEMEAQSPVDHSGADSPGQGPAHVRRASSSINIPTAQSPVGSQFPRSASNAHAQPPPQFHEDPNIDNLLGDDGIDEEDYEPAELQPVSWRGPINMASHGISLATAARLVAGSDLAARIGQGAIKSLSDVFPRSLTVSGRIESKRADDYLSSLSQATSTDVSVFTLNPNGPTDPSFDHIFKYFHDKQRFAVIDVASLGHLQMVRDFYIAPLEAGSQRPQFLDRLGWNNLPAKRPHRLLLAIVVCKWPNTLDGAQATPTTTSQPGMSPAAPLPQANTPQNNGQSMPGFQPPTQQQYQQHPQYSMPMHQSPSIPGNPYLPPQQQHAQQHYPPQPSQPAQNFAPPPSSKEAVAFEILGPLVNTHVARSILAQQNVAPEQLRNLKRIFEKYPETRDDLNLFSRVLSENPEAVS